MSEQKSFSLPSHSKHNTSALLEEEEVPEVALTDRKPLTSLENTVAFTKELDSRENIKKTSNKNIFLKIKRK